MRIEVDLFYHVIESAEMVFEMPEVIPGFSPKEYRDVYQCRHIDIYHEMWTRKAGLC